MRKRQQIQRQSAQHLPSGVSQSSAGTLDATTRVNLESRFSHDFSGVRLHTDEMAAESARSLNARAYTIGRDVFFGAGQYQPQSGEGWRLLAHEFAHVVQQDNAVPSGNPVMVPPNHPTETEADRAAVHEGFIPRLTTGQAVIQRQQAGTPVIDPGIAVGTFSPAPGLTVDRTGQNIRISGRLEIFGPEATPAMASTIQSTINRIWNGTFPDGNIVSCGVTVSHRAGKTATSGVAQIEVARKGTDASYVSGSRGNKHMVLNLDGPDVLNWVAGHEFGHMLGMDDRYSESTASQLGIVQRKTTPNPGYQGNLMAEHQGTLASKNVRDLAAENAPGWTDDDDQVRDWLNGHSPAEIQAISTPDKIRMINTLMGGWISAEDVNAIIAICRSVTSSAEANTIRTTFNPLLIDMSSIGQRTQVRVAFAQMP